MIFARTKSKKYKEFTFFFWVKKEFTLEKGKRSKLLQKENTIKNLKQPWGLNLLAMMAYCQPEACEFLSAI